MQITNEPTKATPRQEKAVIVRNKMIAELLGCSVTQVHYVATGRHHNEKVAILLNLWNAKAEEMKIVMRNAVAAYNEANILRQSPRATTAAK